MWVFAGAVVSAALLAGSLAYCVLALIAVASYRRQRPQSFANLPYISVLKPLHGYEEGLEQNLRTFFEQDYPEFEVLFAVSSPDDPAAVIARTVMQEHPKTSSRLIVSGAAPTPNRKVHSLRAMAEHAKYDVLLMADSDVRAGSDLLRVVGSEIAQANVGAVFCPYRASAGRSFWTVLEALGMNTEFMPQILLARFLRGLDFALGPTLAVRREALERIGGFDHLQRYLAEDFVIGNRIAKSGGAVALSSYVIEHRLGAQSLADSMRHRLRWARSTRRSRPLGYLGQVFTNPLPLALLFVGLVPAFWPALFLAVALRSWVAWSTSRSALRDPLTSEAWVLLPLQDLVSFAVWIGGFFGTSIIWRGEKIRILRDGRFAGF